MIGAASNLEWIEEGNSWGKNTRIVRGCPVRAENCAPHSDHPSASHVEPIRRLPAVNSEKKTKGRIPWTSQQEDFQGEENSTGKGLLSVGRVQVRRKNDQKKKTNKGSTFSPLKDREGRENYSRGEYARTSEFRADPYGREERGFPTKLDNSWSGGLSLFGMRILMLALGITWRRKF